MGLSIGEVEARAKDIKALILDVDGVLTDGKVVFLPNGAEGKTFHVRDGLGIQLAQVGGLSVAFLSGRDSEAVRRRASELGVEHVHLGIADKLAGFEGLLTQLKLQASEVAYVGDDLPDLPLLDRAGLGFAVADAAPELRAAADIVLRSGGGEGAVREACEQLLKVQGRWLSP